MLILCGAKSRSSLAWATSWRWDENGILPSGLRDRDSLNRTNPSHAAVGCLSNDSGTIVFHPTTTKLERAASYASLASEDEEALERHLLAIAQNGALRPYEAIALAKLYETRNEHTQAVAIVRDSRVARDLQSLAKAAYVCGRTEDARRLAGLVIEADPASAEAYYLLGQISVLYGDAPDAAQDAVDHFSRGVALRPADMAMRTGLAHALVQAARNEEALEQLRIVLEATPTNPTAHLLLGEVYLNDGHLDEAIREYETCLSLAPEQIWALYGLGRSYGAQGKKGEATDALKRALVINPHFDAARQALAAFR